MPSFRPSTFVGYSGRKQEARLSKLFEPSKDKHIAQWRLKDGDTTFIATVNRDAGGPLELQLSFIPVQGKNLNLAEVAIWLESVQLSIMEALS